MGPVNPIPYALETGLSARGPGLEFAHLNSSRTSYATRWRRTGWFGATGFEPLHLGIRAAGLDVERADRAIIGAASDVETPDHVAGPSSLAPFACLSTGHGHCGRNQSKHLPAWHGRKAKGASEAPPFVPASESFYRQFGLEPGWMMLAAPPFSGTSCGAK
jgi:hypothetical protein